MATADSILALATAALNNDPKMVVSVCRSLAANERESSTLRTRMEKTAGPCCPQLVKSWGVGAGRHSGASPSDDAKSYSS